ncbi:MAG: hypothetical protein CVU57_15355 [Deltaproteobacteria bacterium HGW-Deltaproteobacteria-15]|nr:MAG: hypothetical protein CVU57_15355 [Deltaproteobacteria bacterium HGW-Deltaproteobacteria-15]
MGVLVFPRLLLKGADGMKTRSCCLLLGFIGGLFIFSSCVTGSPAPKVEKGLSPSELSRYSDTFDKFREDLWNVAGYIPQEEIIGENFKLADMRVKDGQLRIETRTGCYSAGGVGSNFALKGDFDIQVDCKVEFVKSARDMDQLLSFNLRDMSKELSDTEIESININIFKLGQANPQLVAFYRQKGRIHRPVRREVDDFDGSLRISRKGIRATTMFRKKGESEWKELGRFVQQANEVLVTLRAQNFAPRRKEIGAGSPFIVVFDNFIINSADAIIEQEI